MYSSVYCQCLGAHTLTNSSHGSGVRSPSLPEVAPALKSVHSRHQHSAVHPKPKYVYASDGAAYTDSPGDCGGQNTTADSVFGTEAARHFRDGASGPVDGVAAAWDVNWQMDERNLLWNDDIKIRFVKHTVAQELRISQEELEDRLQALCNVIPDLASRLMKAPPKQLAALVAGTHTVAERLLQLRSIFPLANVSQLLERRLSLLLEDDITEIQAAAERLRQLLPYIQVDKFVEAHPQVLEVADFELAMEDAKRLMPQIDVAHALRNSPDLILGLQKGKHLIPYDEPWPIKNA